MTESIKGDITHQSNPKNPNQYSCRCSTKSRLIIDTGVCSIPKNGNLNEVSYQTYCPRCGDVGSIRLTKEQIAEVIKSEEDGVIDVVVETNYGNKN